MLLYKMLYIMLAYIMLLAALSNAACLYDAFFLYLPLIFANSFCFHALSCFNDPYFFYFKYYFASCTVLLIFFSSILCSHRKKMKELCALWRNST